MSSWRLWDNDWESQLASWKPRRPSPRLKASLFPQTDASRRDLPEQLRVGWRWLAPALVCTFMAMVGLNPHNEQFGEKLNQTNYPAFEMARAQRYAAYLVANFHSEQNGLRREPLEWTFAAPSNSPLGSWPDMVTNNLLH